MKGNQLYQLWLARISGEAVAKKEGRFITKDGRVIFIGGAGSGGGTTSGTPAAGGLAVTPKTFGAADFATSSGATLLSDFTSASGNRQVLYEHPNPEMTLGTLHARWAKGNRAVRRLSPLEIQSNSARFTAELLNDVNAPTGGWHRLTITIQQPEGNP